VEFLRARLDEDAGLADEWHSKVECDTYGPVPFPCDCHVPARVLADVAAKRAIVDAYVHKAESMARYPGQSNAGGLVSLTVAAQHLAAVYADHPDYDQGWAP
jgi:hypothetical protein